MATPVLTEADLRAALRLVNEARDFPRGSAEQIDHLMRGLADLVHAQVGRFGGLTAGPRILPALEFGGANASGHTLHRTRNDAPFDDRDRALVNAVCAECTFLSENAPTASLPPRLREVLSLLAEGQSEKQVAAELELSAHTVHDYVKALHRRLGVQSRGELLAVALRA